MGRQGPRGVTGYVWGHRVGLMSPLIIQKAYAFIQGIQTFIAGGWTDGWVNQKYYKRSLRT